MSGDATAAMLGDAIEKLLQKHDAPAATWRALREAGLLSALLPEEAGGFGVAVPDALRLLRIVAAHAVPLPVAETMLAGYLLAGAGLEVPNAVLSLGPVVPGEEMPLLQRSGADWHVAASLSRVPWGRDAEGIALLAMFDGRPHLALVRNGAWRASPGENLAGEPRDGLAIDANLSGSAVAPTAIDAMQFAALGAAARVQQIAGALERVAEMTVAYAKERVQFGRPIARFQAVQQNLAILAGQAAAATAAADIAAEAVAAGIRVDAIAAAKARAGEAAGIGAAIAHQVFGAIGFTEEHALHRLTKRLWSWRDEFGGEASWSLLFGRHLLAASRGPGSASECLWQALTAI